MYIKKLAAIALAFGIAISSIFSSFAYDLDSINTKADILNKLSILTGTLNGYNLDKNITRGEAATFIVKVLGKDKYVKENADQLVTKFPDVEEGKWYTPYVNYCSNEGIISGDNTGNFGPNKYLSEKAFLSMILKAMSYSDYTWSNIYERAYSIGLLTDKKYANQVNDNNNYKRGDVIELLYNALTHKINSSNKSFLEKMIDEGFITRENAQAAGFNIDALKLDIINIQTVNEIQLKVEFNEPINNLSPDDIKIYMSDGTGNVLSFEILSQTGNELILKTGRQEKNKGYMLEIKNCSDLEGNITEKLSTKFKGFSTTAVQSDFFKISNVEPVNRNTINVYFTHPVNSNAEYAPYYQILNGDQNFINGNSRNLSIKAMSSNQYGVTIYLKENALTDMTEYTLRITGGLMSLYGVSLGDQFGDSINFIANNNNDTEQLKVDGISVINNKTVQIDFNKELNAIRAEQVFSYYLTTENGSPIQVDKALLSVDPKNKGKGLILTISGTTFEKSRKYNLLINYVEDSTKQYVLENSPYSFMGDYISSQDIYVQQINVIDAGTMEVNFNRELDEKTATTVTNYIIQGVSHIGYISSPTKVYYDIRTPKTVKLYFSPNLILKRGETYKLFVQPTLRDYWGNQISKVLDVSFANNSASTIMRTNVSKAVIISRDAIKLSFTTEIAMEKPNIIIGNYSIEYLDDTEVVKRIPISVNFIDARTVVLKFDKIDFDKSYLLRYDKLVDYSENYTSLGSEFGPLEVSVGK